MASGLQSSAACNLTGIAKLAEVTKLLKQLQDDLKDGNLLPPGRDAALEQLKIYGRDPQDADPIFIKEGIEILARHAFDRPSDTTSRNALRCLANAMLLRPATRQIFLDLGYEPKTCSRLKHDSRDDEFLVSRIMFLTTYGTNINLESLIDEHHLAENININIVRHAKLYEEEQKSKSMDDPMEDMALIETLKLLFNVTHFCPQRSASFISSIPHVLTILCKRHIIPKNPLGAPLGFLVNSLINLDFEKNDRAINALFPEANNKVNVERMVELLKLAVQSYNEDEIEQQVSSLLTLLRKVYAAAPNVVKHFMKTVMLPSDDDRKQPLGKAETLSSKLLRLSTSPTAPTAREELSSLLFEMSDKDAKTFVQNVGYGFASGFLFQHNVPVPDDALEARSSAGSGDVKSRASSSGKANNPITGQNLESEEPYDGPEMTREEKEREAEKLMVLFERLRANGVIKAENPMAKAQQEGRFEELHSDDDSE